MCRAVTGKARATATMVKLPARCVAYGLPTSATLIEINAPELVFADWRAGLSCRAIAGKHGIPNHHDVARFLRSRGVDPTSHRARRKIPCLVLGSAVTDRQAAMRRGAATRARAL